MEKILICYIPVIHQGYLNFFKKNDEVKKLGIISPALLKEINSVSRDLRTLSPISVNRFLQSLAIFEKTFIINQKNVNALNVDNLYILPDEDVSHFFAEKYLQKAKVEYQSIFLRWDKKNVSKTFHIIPDTEITSEKFYQEIVNQLEKEAQRSPDWWRQVGAAILKDNKIILTAFNTHLPNHYEISFSGDPRSNFNAGEEIEKTLAIHAEAYLIAQAAEKGIPLTGSSLVVTTFPCPSCAKLIAIAGIKEVYFSEGYSLLNSLDILKEKKIKTIRIQKK